MAKATRAGGISTAEQVAEALLDYHDLLFDPLEDAIEYGRSLLPHTRRLVAERLRNAATAAE